jgi:hypothetical protein
VISGQKSDTHPTQKRTQAAAIERVLQQDKALAPQAAVYMKKGASPANTVDWLVTQMRNIDMSGCPGEFRAAYLRHCDAWRAMANQLRSEEGSVGEQILLGAFNCLTRGEIDGGAGRISAAHDQCSEAIAATFADVEAVAAQYEANLPR